MNKKGFTLVELLATLVILGIVVGITVVSVSMSMQNTKEKTEEIFTETLVDALNIYLDTYGSKLKFDSSKITSITKRFGTSNIYKNTGSLTFSNVINNDYAPLVQSELVNPANKDNNNYLCNQADTINVAIFRDDDKVLYYYVDKNDFGCLNKKEESITNLPCEFFNNVSGYKKPERCN